MNKEGREGERKNGWKEGSKREGDRRFIDGLKVRVLVCICWLGKDACYIHLTCPTREKLSVLDEEGCYRVLSPPDPQKSEKAERQGSSPLLPSLYYREKHILRNPYMHPRVSERVNFLQVSLRDSPLEASLKP